MSSSSYLHVTLVDRDTDSPVVIARSKIISAEGYKVYSGRPGAMIPCIKVHILGRAPIIVQLEPTLENLRSIMPL